VLGSRTVCSVLTLQVLTERTDLLIKHMTYDEAKQLLGSWSVDDFIITNRRTSDNNMDNDTRRITLIIVAYVLAITILLILIVK